MSSTCSSTAPPITRWAVLDDLAPEHAHDQPQTHDRAHGHDTLPDHAAGHGHGHGHSHDPAYLLDDIATTTAAGIRATVIGLIGLLATALTQLVIVTFTGSVALLSDTVHNLGDCLTALPIWLAFRLARRPPSRRFTYGLGRVEDLAGLAVVAAIGASGLYAAWVSVDRLLHPSPTEHAWVVIAAGIVGVVGNEMVARYRIAAGRRIGSLALVADGSTPAPTDCRRWPSSRPVSRPWPVGRMPTRSSAWSSQP